MLSRFQTLSITLLAALILTTSGTLALSETDVGRVKVVMRMIGHQVLLNSGDSTSLVLPVVQDGDTYTISFESDFYFNPDHIGVNDRQHHERKGRIQPLPG